MMFFFVNKIIKKIFKKLKYVRKKKIARGSYGTIYSPNYETDDFKSTKGYISKMLKSYNFGCYEIKQLKKIKKIDPKQNYLVSFKSYSITSIGDYQINIIMKNFGISLNSNKYIKKNYNHIVNVYLKQVLEGLILLHENNIYHKDLHFRNIVYNETENKYRIIDFGFSCSDDDIDYIFNKNNIIQVSKSKKLFLSNHFQSSIVRGDGYHEFFNFDGYKTLDNIVFYFDKNIKQLLKLDLDYIKEQLKLEQQYADVCVLLDYAPFLINNKRETKKLISLIKKITSNKNGKLTARFIYNKLYKNNI